MSLDNELQELIKKALADVLAQPEIAAAIRGSGLSRSPEEDVQAAVKDVAIAVLNPPDLAKSMNRAKDNPDARYAPLLAFQERGEHALMQYENARALGDPVAIDTTARMLAERLFDFSLREFSFIKNDLAISTLEDIAYLGEGDSEKTSWLKQARDDWHSTILDALNVFYASALEDGDIDRAEFLKEKLGLLPDPTFDFFCPLLDSD